MRPTESIALRREPGHLIRSLVALLLRGGLGLIFLTAGLDKIQDMTAAAPPPAEPAGAPAEPAIGPDDEGGTQPGDPGAPAEGEGEGEDEGEDEGEGDDPAAEEAEARYPESIRGMFADTWLGRDFRPALELQTALLPYVEVAVGALLIVGLLTTLGAFVGGLVLLSLLFGQIVLENTDMYPNMLIYLLVDAGILWLSPVTSNYLSLDGLLFGWFWRPKDEGEYRREYEAPPRRA